VTASHTIDIEAVDYHGSANQYLTFVSPQKPNPEEVALRLREAMIARGITTNRDLARRAEIGENAVGDVLNGKRESRENTILALCKALSINHMWLLLGLGERDANAKVTVMHEGRETSSSQLLKPVSLGIDRWLTDTVEGRSTTPEEREYLRSVPWPEPQARHPDIVYHLTLVAYRHAKTQAQGAPCAGPG
jgi:transcriptional regulator with XRE-family HTH domain